VSLLVYPVQYNPVQKILTYYTSINFSLQTSPGIDGSVLYVVKRFWTNSRFS
jgi:hypothetical protein